MNPSHGNLALNNIPLHSFDPRIPKAERKAIERQNLKEKRLHVKCAWETTKQAVRKQIQTLLDTNILSSLAPGTRFITKGYDGWMGYEYCIYEIVSVDGATARVQMIYSDVSGDSLFRKGDSYNEHSITVGWLMERVLVFPSQIHNSMKLLEHSGEREPEDSYVVTPSETNWVSTNPCWYIHHSMDKSYHAENISRLSELFLSSPDTSKLTMENENQTLTVTWMSYTIRYCYDGSPIPAPEVGAGYWFSHQYRHTIDTILKYFEGKQVCIRYSEIIHTSALDDFIEIPGSVITWIIGELDSECQWLGSIRVIDGLHNGKSVTHIPEEAFLAWCRIECV